MSRKKQIIIPLGILIIGIGSYMGFASMKQPPAEKEKTDTTPIVSVKPVSVSDMTLTVNTYGVVKPKIETTLVAQVSGQIVELSESFVRGGFVKKGQLLARIDPNDYEANLLDAQANLASAQASLEQERAQGQVAANEWKRIKRSTPSELSLRKPQLAKELARVKSAQAQVKRAKRNLERTRITAPYDAMIDARNIGLGSFVSLGSTVGKVLGTDLAEIRLPVPDHQLQFLTAQGVNANVMLQGDFAGKRTSWPAQIVRNEGVVDSSSRMSYLVAQVDDPYGLAHFSTPLRFGAYVKANITGKNISNATIIPRHLLVEDKVAIFDNDSTLQFVPVSVVRHQGSDVVVSGGLHQGDRMIVSALDYPVNGMKLALSSVDKTAPPSVETAKIPSNHLSEDGE